MSIKSFLFKSTKEAIFNTGPFEDISNIFKGISSDSIDPTTLAILESILSGEDLFTIYQRGEYDTFCTLDKKSQPRFICASSRLLELLKNFTGNSEVVVKRWCNSKEMTLYNWSTEDARTIFDWLIDTAHATLQPQERIILYLEHNIVAPAS
jgi:hypothetical protein